MTKKKDASSFPRARTRSRRKPSQSVVPQKQSIHNAGDEIQFGDWLIKLKGTSGTSICTATATENETKEGGGKTNRIHAYGGTADLALEAAKELIKTELKARKLFQEQVESLIP